MLKSDNFFVQYEYGLVRNHPADGNFSHPRYGRLVCTPNTDGRKPHEQADKAESLYRRARARSRRLSEIRNQRLDVRGGSGKPKRVQTRTASRSPAKKGVFCRRQKTEWGDRRVQARSRRCAPKHTRPDFDRRKIFEKRPCTNEKGML